MMEHTDPDANLLDHINPTCPNCKPVVTFNPSRRQRIIEHIGAHILHDPSVNRLTEPCGLCLQPAPSCKIVLKKAKGQMGSLAVDMKASSCPNLVKFSVAIAAESSHASPCTNHPIVCPHCHDSDSESSPVIWSYNFQSHMRRKHPRISLKDHRLSNISVLTNLEREGMERVWGNRLKQQKVHRKSQRAPLVISETHRSRLVLKYELLFYFINKFTDTQIHSSEVVPGLGPSDDDCSSDGYSGRDEEAAESDDEDNGTPVMTETRTDNGKPGEEEDLEYGGERYLKTYMFPC